MKAWTIARSWGIALAATIWLAAPCAQGLVITVSDSAELSDAILDANVDEIVLSGNQATNPGVFTIPATISINRDMTIRGEGTSMPYQILLASSSGAAFEVFEGNAVTFENLKISGDGIVLSGGCVVKVNRVLFTGGLAIATTGQNGAGLAKVVVANSCFSESTVGVRLRGAGDELTAYQSTFRDGGSAVEVTNGAGAALAACLIDGPGFNANGGLVNLQGCFPSIASPPPGVIEMDPAPALPGAPEYATGANWPGKLVPSGMILSGLSYSGTLGAAVRLEIDEFSATDFEREGRDKGNLQVGADEVGGIFLPPQWQAVSITRDPVGKNIETEITIATGFDLRAGDQLLIVPESITNNPGFNINNEDPANFITLNLPIDSASAELSAVTVPFTPTSTYINGDILLDGRATIMLAAGGVIYNPLSAGSNITAAVASAAFFVIDTIAPAYVFDTDATGTAADLVNYANDAFNATNVPVGFPPTFPLNWIPANNPQPTNDALIGDGSGRTPVILLNTPRTTDLDLTIEASFFDEQPADKEGQFVAYAGFDPGGFSDVASGANILTSLTTVPTEATGFSRAYWSNSVLPANLLATTGLTTTFGPDGNGAMRAVWRLTGLPYDDAGWHINIRIVAVDEAGNGTEEGVPLSVWWLDSAAGVITNGPSGNATTDPAFTWAVGHPPGVASPGDVAPLVPAASFRIWEADTPGPDPLWAPLVDWSPFTTAPVVDRSSVVNDELIPPGRLGELLDLNVHQGKRLMLTIIGADELGNVQPWVLGNDLVTFADLDAAGVDYAPWQNGDAPGADGTRLDSSISATFWHNRADNPGTIRAIDPVEQSFGDSRRIPLPAEEDCYDRVEGRFNVQADFPDDLDPALVQFAQFELFEDGRLVAIGYLRDLANPKQTHFSLQIPEDFINPSFEVLPLRAPVVTIDPRDFLNAAPAACNRTKDRLGDEGDSEAGVSGARNRLRDVNYVLAISAGYGTIFPTEPCIDCIFDPTPASIEFTVAIERDLRSGESPVIVNEKLGN